MMYSGPKSAKAQRWIRFTPRAERELPETKAPFCAVPTVALTNVIS